ncbi:hypothetical protein KR52_08420 [Synechococcus sp. KORDI-52]|nr:hypothetical protein KR52_08420 [Synechococcus sp. KORDI-52]
MKGLSEHLVVKLLLDWPDTFLITEEEDRLVG